MDYERLMALNAARDRAQPPIHLWRRSHRVGPLWAISSGDPTRLIAGR